MAACPSYKMTINKLLQKAIKVLQEASHTPELDSEILLAFVLGKDKAHLVSYKNKEVSKYKQQKFFNLIQKRKKRAPIAYLTNKKEFYGLEFFIDENVLIPRPETEKLVELSHGHIVSLLKKGVKNIKVVDVGTGCGNIGITLIHLILKEKLNKKAKFTLYMTDISGKALKIARRNFKRLINKENGIKIYFVKTDLLKDVKCDFDIIVSNPPYIPSKQIEFLEPNVRDYEPRVALDGGEGGIKIVKQLISQAVKQLNKNGALFFEIHEKHPNDVKLFLEENYPNWGAKFYKDCFGEWRFAEIINQMRSN
jgi:release factor glutamine methyltransferase